MGQVRDGLHRALEGAHAQLVEHQGQDDRRREPDQQAQQADLDGVHEHPAHPRVGEQPVEVLQSRPGAAQDAVGGDEFLERQGDAVDGDVAEDDEEHQPRHHEKEEVLGPIQFRQALL